MEDFESWFDIVIDKCNSLGYEGPIDKGTFEDEYEMNPDKSPEAAAEEFVKEMTE